MNDHVYSYDDLPEGQTDPTMAKFSLDPDRADVIPVLKQILAINPKIKILASPWSAPSWMKTNNNVKGGKLRPEYYDAYSSYFIQYIQGMSTEGIVIDALTIQNEPLNERTPQACRCSLPISLSSFAITWAQPFKRPASRPGSFCTITTATSPSMQPRS